ncbi:MAG TPA: trigger factor [Methylomirabilota bacterium]|jgi:trigger factor
MKVDVETLEECKRRLAVEAPLDVVEKAWERAYGRVQKQARLPGFRKGHVPRSLVKLHFSDDVRRDVAEHLIPDVYRQAVSEAQIDPVNEPDLQDVTLEEGAPLSFVAVVEVKPTITLGDDYAAVAVQHAPTPVTDDDVDTTLEQMREQHAEFRAVERAAAAGDLVIVDYTLAPEGLEATTANGYHFEVGSGTVLPEIDEAVVGLRAGDERDIPLRFADDHRLESLRGKSGKAQLKLVEVKEKVLPALDDDFAKTLGDFDTLAAVRTEIRRQLEARRAADDRREIEDKLVEAVLARHDFTVPGTMVMRQIGNQVEHARERMRREGMDPDRVPWDYGKLVTELRPGAEKAVKRALLLEAIAERESIEAADSEVETEVGRIAAASQRPAPAVRRMMEKSGDLAALRHGLRDRKTLDFLIARASVNP